MYEFSFSKRTGPQGRLTLSVMRADGRSYTVTPGPGVRDEIARSGIPEPAASALSSVLEEMVPNGLGEQSAETRERVVEEVKIRLVAYELHRVALSSRMGQERARSILCEIMVAETVIED